MMSEVKKSKVSIKIHFTGAAKLDPSQKEIPFNQALGAHSER